jgi:PIN domain nuclease of toxin-antitoxin system
MLLCERGRIRLSPNPRAWIDQALSKAPLREARLSWTIALLSRGIQLEHQDPADRFLAATAAALDLTLVTADELLLRGKGYKVLPAH